jgi:hypothetical protein
MIGLGVDEKPRASIAAQQGDRNFSADEKAFDGICDLF